MNPRTYGTATLNGTEWELNVEPQVALRLKRVFPSIPAGWQGTLTLTATEANSRELEWFAQRYPLVWEPENALEALTAKARAFDRRAERAAAIIAGHYEPSTVRMAIPPRPYQQQAADLCVAMGGLLVGDELGLGKTVTALTLLAHPETRPAIVVVPTHLQAQWKAEAERFMPGIRVHVARSTRPDYVETWAQGDLEEGFWPPDVLVVTYHKLSGWAEVLSAGPFKSIVFDEAQELRRADSAKYEAAAAIAGAMEYRMGLSATPIYNYGAEFWTVLNVLRPGELGDRWEFGAAWCGGKWADKARIQDVQAFGGMLREHALMIRRTRADAGRELPELTNIVHEFDPQPDALQEVDSRATELARVLLGEGGAGFDKMRAAEELSNLLRQQTGLAKAPYVAEFTRMLLEETGEPVVLYGWHRAVYEVWREYFAYLRPAWYTGSETPARKEREKQRFLSGDTPLMILSLRAGQGLDGLQAVAHRAVMGELDWSPGVHEQCVGRIHRDGQTEPTLAYYLVATLGADPIMVDVLGIKRGQIERVRDPEGPLAVPKQADPDHIKQLAKHYLEHRSKAADFPALAELYAKPKQGRA